MSGTAHNERSLLTVEEAADRLGLSVATARRMAKDGRLQAVKSGRQWVVDASSLPRQRRTRGSAAAPRLDLALALRHVKQTDLAEAWVPDILREEDLLAEPSVVEAQARDAFDQLAPGDAIPVEVDKTVIFTRDATMLSLEDRVAYQGAVASFAKRADAQLHDCVFSARLSADSRYFFKRGTKQWVAWRDHALQQVEERGDGGWMIKTDLTAYFDTIRHDLLLAELRSLNTHPHVVRALAEMLKQWSPVPDVGLPQGPNASRLLGNIYMLPVDRAMLDAGWQYSRFLDDIRIVTRSKADAITAVRHFQQECRIRGLIVSSSKTELLNAVEARRDLQDESQLNQVEYLMDIPSLARPQLKKILRSALKSESHVNERHVRFSLWRLAQLRESGTLGLVMRRLEDLAPTASVVAAYLQPFISRPTVVKGLAEFLGDDGRCRSPRLTAYLLAVMLEHPGELPGSWSSEAARRVRDRNAQPYIRTLAAVVMARGGRPADIRWIKDDISKEHNPEVLRGYAVALHWVRALDQTTQRQLSRRSDRLPLTLRYLKGRTTLPSLVYRNRTLTLPR